jgi:hypothetical protein
MKKRGSQMAVVGGRISSRTVTGNFVHTRPRLSDSWKPFSGVLSAQSQGDVGFVKVVLRREAWAKSHRPMATLFRNDRTPIVGGDDLGVMIIEARPSTMRQVAAEIAKAEAHTEMRFDPNREKEVPPPFFAKERGGEQSTVSRYTGRLTGAIFRWRTRSPGSPIR